MADNMQVLQRLDALQRQVEQLKTASRPTTATLIKNMLISMSVYWLIYYFIIRRFIFKPNNVVVHNAPQTLQHLKQQVTSYFATKYPHTAGASEGFLHRLLDHARHFFDMLIQAAKNHPYLAGILVLVGTLAVVFYVKKAHSKDTNLPNLTTKDMLRAYAQTLKTPTEVDPQGKQLAYQAQIQALNVIKNSETQFVK